MLDLTRLLRRYLHQAGTLVYDHDGQEVFIGLTHFESEFLIKYSGSGSALPSAERRLYYHLKELHLVARLRLLKLAPRYEW